MGCLVVFLLFIALYTMIGNAAIFIFIAIIVHNRHKMNISYFRTGNVYILCTVPSPESS